MRRIVFAVVVLFLAPSFLYAGERIQYFGTLVRVNDLGTLSVTERIEYDFGVEERHGIFRNIPYRYSTGFGTKTTKLDNFQVVNEAGEQVRFVETSSGGHTELKIGDPNTYVTGVQTYVISYDVEDAVLFFDDHDEVFWNVTGDDWPLPISRVEASLVLGIQDATFTEGSCYQGPYGSKEECFAESISDDKKRYEAIHQGLAAREGVTLAASFPKDFIERPSSLSVLLSMVRDNGVVLIPITALFLLGYLWYSRGRDPKGRGAVVRQYSPPEGLTPAEAGVVLDEWAQAKDITAEIIYLATKGYLKVHQFERKKLVFTDTEYLLEKLKEYDESLPEFDQLLLDALFASGNITTERIEGVGDVEGVILSSLRHKLHEDFSDLQKILYEITTERGYFVRNPSTTRTKYIVGGILLVIATGVASFFVGVTVGLLAICSLLATGCIVVIFGIFMPKRTRKGVETKEHILGLKEYLSIAEKDRLEFHNNPERTPEWFDQMLPYAMMLGVEREWAKLFEEIYHEAPTWYASHTTASFNAALFAADLKGFGAAVGSTTQSAPSSSGSSGGGFSGGGFGGGGGGSW